MTARYKISYFITFTVPDPDEVVAVGEGNLGGIEDPPDLDGTLIREIPVNSNVRKSTRNAKRRFNCLNEENPSKFNCKWSRLVICQYFVGSRL